MKLNEQILDQLIEEMLSEGLKQRPFTSLNLKISNYNNKEKFIKDNYANLVGTFKLKGNEQYIDAARADKMKAFSDLLTTTPKTKAERVAYFSQINNIVKNDALYNWDIEGMPLTDSTNRKRIKKAIDVDLKTRKIVVDITKMFKNNFDENQAKTIASSRGNSDEIEDEDLYLAITLKGFNQKLKDNAIKFIQDVIKIQDLPKTPDIEKSLEIIKTNIPGVEDKKLPLDPFYSDDLGIQDPTKKLGRAADVPSYVKGFFEKSGIFAGDATTTIGNFNEFMQIYADSSQFAPGKQSIQSLFNNVMVSEYFYKIVLDLLEGTSKRLQGAGRKLESFMGLLLSGTPQVSYTEFDDLILFQNNKAEYYSLKLLSTSTMIYQAASTVESFWKRNPGQPIKYVAGVKDFTEGDVVTIDLYERVYTEQDFTDAKKSMNQDVAENSIVYIGKEEGMKKTPFFGIQGTPKNRKHRVDAQGRRTFNVEIADTNLYKNTKNTTIKDTQLYNKDTDHVVFKDFGKKIASIKLPRDPSIFRVKKKEFFNGIGIAVEDLYQKISEFKNAATEYFSDSDEEKRITAVKAKNSLNSTGKKLLGIATENKAGTYASATPSSPQGRIIEKNEKITEEILDKLIKEVILLK
jgi:hypothetical protein